MISIAQTVFQNGLVKALPEDVPGLDPMLLLHAGATQIRNVLEQVHQESALRGALIAYVKGLTDAYYIAVACACLAFLAACGLEWKSVKKGGVKKEPAVSV